MSAGSCSGTGGRSVRVAVLDDGAHLPGVDSVLRALEPSAAGIFDGLGSSEEICFSAEAVTAEAMRSYHGADQTGLDEYDVLVVPGGSASSYGETLGADGLRAGPCKTSLGGAI